MKRREGQKSSKREGLMAVDFCLGTMSAFDDLSLSVKMMLVEMMLVEMMLC